ncbi:hypothetical protein CCAN11_2470026 [Capnocytophaga canimorsus]|uniref:Uncharacterized protein n=1 Tax=Capnocytophaga canimorsus TaxID=28188 RepID=A0A0B7IKT9_9FLAO|nr:hypothetical protein CCAN11_2470026 [Capnocytophaga canimorsus]
MYICFAKRNATQRNATQRNATQRNATQRLSYPLIKNLLTHVYTFSLYIQHFIPHFLQLSKDLLSIKQSKQIACEHFACKRSVIFYTNPKN